VAVQSTADTSGRYLAEVFAFGSTSNTSIFATPINDAFAPEGPLTPTIASASSDGKTVLYTYTSMNKINTAEGRVIQGGRVVQKISIPNYWLSASQISIDGNLVSLLLASDAGDTVVVVDRTLNAVTLNATLPFENALGWCVSPSGTYMVHGFTSFTAWARNTKGQFNSLGTVNLPNDFYVGACAVSDGGLLVTALTNYNGDNEINIQAYSINAGSIQAKWSWSTGIETDPDKLQDAVSGATMTSDGSVFVYSSWGTGPGNTPTVRAFLTNPTGPTPTPFLEFTTPGSVFWVDAVGSSSNGISVLAACKHVHANIFGDGGDLYLVDASPSAMPL